MIIALMGRAKAGKDTIGGMIHAALPGQVARVAFADKLKQVCMDVFGLSRDDVHTEQGKDRRTQYSCLRCRSCQSLDCFEWDAGRMAACLTCKDASARENFTVPWTPRMILQHTATEMRRVDNDVFVRLTMREARRLRDEASVATVVITDCRFRVEADAVWRAGGQVWRVRRPSTDGQPQGIAGHVSEVEMDTIPEALFQRVIVNDGSLEDLMAKVVAALPA